MIFSILLPSLIRPCFGANLLDPGKFSQALSKLAAEGLGAANLQVKKYNSKYYCKLLSD